MNRWDKRLNITHKRWASYSRPSLYGDPPAPLRYMETINRGDPLLAKKEQQGHLRQCPA